MVIELRNTEKRGATKSDLMEVATRTASGPSSSAGPERPRIETLKENDTTVIDLQKTKERAARIAALCISCDGPPHAARPTWLWPERQNRIDSNPADDRTPRQRGEAVHEELEERGTEGKA